MKSLLKKLVVLAIVVAGAWWVWSHRDRIAVLSNNNVRIEGYWYRVEMNFKQQQAYNFEDGMITVEGREWGTYMLRKNTRLEITVGIQGSDYVIEFPDDDNMIWYVETSKGPVVNQRWRR